MLDKVIDVRFNVHFVVVACALTCAMVGAGGPSRAEPSRVDVLTIALGGDVYIDAPTRNGLRRRTADIGEDAAYRELLSEIAPALRAADLTIVNLETPIAPRHRERRPGEPPIFNASEGLLSGLVDAGVDALTLANNHAYDQGHRGLRETLTALHRHKLVAVGVAPTSAAAPGPVLLKTAAGDVGLCAWTQSVNVRAYDEPDEDQPTEGTLRVAMTRDAELSSCLSRARKRTALTVAALHWTTTEWRGPGPNERALVQAAVDGGADLVVGHGPHVPGPTARLRAADGREALVIYSLGNLIGAMGMEHALWRRRRAGVRDAPVVVVTARRALTGRLVATSVGLHPFWIASESRGTLSWPDGQPQTRPLSITRELGRLATAACGQRCDTLSGGYRRRAAALAAAFTIGEEAPTLLALAEDAPSTAGPPLPSASTSANVEPEAPAEPPVDAVADANADETTRENVASVAATDGVTAGVTLPLRFQPNRVAAEVTDEAALDRVVALIESRGDARIVLTGFAVPGEDLMPPERFGARRARAAMWLIASRGPSRSRFEVRGGPTSDRPRVELHLAP